MANTAVPGRYTVQVTVTVWANNRSDAYRQIKNVLSDRKDNVTFVDAEDTNIEPFCANLDLDTHDEYGDERDLAVAGGNLCAACLDLKVGDTVDVLNGIRLPKVEQVVHTGVIERITQSSVGHSLYWISGRGMALTANVLRKLPHRCRFCGAPSRIAVEDQVPPPDYCHPSDHGMEG